MAVNPSERLKLNVFKECLDNFKAKYVNAKSDQQEKSFELKMPAIFALLGARNEELKSI